MIKKYARLVVEHPLLFLSIFVVLTMFLAIEALHVGTKSTDYSKVLPGSFPEISAFDYIKDEFGMSGNSITLLVVADSVPDVRYVLKDMYSFEKSVASLEHVVSVTGLPDVVLEYNGRLSPDVDLNKNITVKINVTSPVEITGDLGKGIDTLHSLLENQRTALLHIKQALNGLKNASTYSSNALLFIADSIPDKFEFPDDLLTTTYVLESSVNFSLKPEVMKLRYGLMGIKSGFTQLETRLSSLKESLTEIALGQKDIAQGFEEISTGIDGALELNRILDNSLSNLELGIESLQKYLELYFPKHSESRIIKFNPYSQFVSKDYRYALIRVNLDDMNDTEQTRFLLDLDQLIQKKSIPGTKIVPVGSIVTGHELREQIRPTMQRTSMVSVVGIFLIVVVLFASIRHGITSLLAIIFGVLWTYGVLGLLGISISPEMSGGLSMIMGIGVDFGIQVVNRFREEIEKNSLEVSLYNTWKFTLKPMFITTVAAIIGFRAMYLSRVMLLGELADMMTIGVIMCFIAAITVVPTILVIFHKKRNK